MTTVYVLKDYADQYCNSSTILGIYRDRADAIRERDRLRAQYPARLVSRNILEEPFDPRYLIDVSEYELI